MKRNKIVFVGDISDMYGNVITLYNEKAKKIIAVQIKETSYISCTPRIGLKVRCEYYTDNKSSSVIIDHLDEVIIGISASNNK